MSLRNQRKDVCTLKNNYTCNKLHPINHQGLSAKYYPFSSTPPPPDAILWLPIHLLTDNLQPPTIRIHQKRRIIKPPKLLPNARCPPIFAPTAAPRLPPLPHGLSRGRIEAKMAPSTWRMSEFAVFVYIEHLVLAVEAEG